MILILVKKEWIAEVGEATEGMLIREHSSALSIAYAGRVHMEYPFVQAEMARKVQGGKAFVPVHIPVDAIRGIFDLTDEQEKALGFMNRA
jgi:hypothetical protein